jgi:hypothetical protein
LSLYFRFIVTFGKKKKKCPNDKKEIYNDKYRHTRDRLFGLYITMKEKRGTILIKTRGTQNPSLVLALV